MSAVDDGANHDDVVAPSRSRAGAGADSAGAGADSAGAGADRADRADRAENAIRGPRGVKPQVGEDVLVARAQHGDPRAFEQLVRRYQQSMYSVALRILSDPDEAEDAAQNAFIAAWRRLPEFRSESKFSTWMYRIVTNQALNQARSRQRQAQPVEIDQLEPRSSGEWTSTVAGTDPEQQAQQSALMAAIAKALASLPEELRICWLLREMQDCPYQDIADITNVSLDTARGRIYRARLRLSEEMAAWR